MDAKGVQIYKAVEIAPGRFQWELEAPLADLYDDRGKQTGWHYQGPAWEAVDGSKVSLDKEEKLKSAPAPEPKENIPWLLVPVKAEDAKAGQLSKVAWVQRVQTVGGKPPPHGPNRAGTKVGIPYKAVYYFYTKGK
jgi:hypothetical protein